jgi:hypothetical protein
MNHETIYVAITAFDELFTKQTINSCLENAMNPERVFIGVNSSSSDGCFQDFSMYGENVKVAHCAVEEPRGFGIDRCGSYSFWNGQNYCLQIDAHMLFVKNWDYELISQLYKLKTQHNVQKPILSTYMPSWTTDENGGINGYMENDENACCQVIQTDYTNSLFKHYGTYGNSICGDNFIEQYYISAHFMFMDSIWLEEVGYDPMSVFIGEELMLAIRSWTRGYRIFAYGIPYLWHLTKTNFGPTDWRVAMDSAANKSNINFTRQKLEIERLKMYLAGEKFDKYGAPNKESLDAYQKAIGIDFNKIYKQNT